MTSIYDTMTSMSGLAGPAVAKEGADLCSPAVAAPFASTAEKWWIFDGGKSWEYPGIETEGESIVIVGEGGDECGVRGDTPEIRLARARLIAAAPDLLRAGHALRNAQRAYMADRGNDTLGKGVQACAETLDAAIAKAEGRNVES